MRTSLRRKCYLDNAEKEVPHTSVDGKCVLNEELVNFTWEAKERLEEIVKTKFHNHNIKSKSICATRAEFEDQCLIDNFTKNEILVRIYELFEMMEVDSATSKEDIFKKTVKNKSKKNYVSFYYKLQNILNETTVVEEESDD